MCKLVVSIEINFKSRRNVAGSGKFNFNIIRVFLLSSLTQVKSTNQNATSNKGGWFLSSNQYFNQTFYLSRFQKRLVQSKGNFKNIRNVSMSNL